MCKNKKNIFSSIVGIVNVILLIPLLCMHFPRITDSNLGLDYMGIIVGILSLLVTVLIGWNIYTALDLSKRTKEIEDKVSIIIPNTESALLDIQQRTKEQFDRQSKKNTESEEYMLGAIDYVQGMILMNSGDPRKMLNAKTFFSAISHFIKSPNTKHAIEQCIVEFEKCVDLDERQPNYNELYNIDMDIIHRVTKDIEMSDNSEFTDELRNKFRELSIKFMKKCELHKTIIKNHNTEKI